jgi:hypothetical protein
MAQGVYDCKLSHPRNWFAAIRHNDKTAAINMLFGADRPAGHDIRTWFY